MGTIGCFSFFPEQEPRRVRRRRARHDRRRGARRTKSGCCATTAPSRSIFTSASAATSGSTRCRRRCCGSSCRTWARGRDARRANADRYDRLFARARAWPGASTLPDPAGGSAPHLQPVRRSACRDRDAVRARLDGGRHRHRGLLSRAVPPAGVLRARSAIAAGRFPRRNRRPREVLALPIYPRAHRRAAARRGGRARRAPWPDACASLSPAPADSSAPPSSIRSRRELTSSH